jgi:hypothetical protein
MPTEDERQEMLKEPELKKYIELIESADTSTLAKMQDLLSDEIKFTENANLEAGQEELNLKEYYPITSVSKDDLRQLNDDRDETIFSEEEIKSLTDSNMKALASLLSDSFCECCYWSHLEDRTKTILKFKKKRGCKG